MFFYTCDDKRYQIFPFCTSIGTPGACLVCGTDGLPVSISEKSHLYNELKKQTRRYCEENYGTSHKTIRPNPRSVA